MPTDYNDFNRRFNAQRDAFDKTFKRATRGIFAVWAISALASVSIVAVFIWAIIRVVQHYT